MILFAVTWDINGGQMGYNSFGNVFFFGIGVYVCAVVQRDSGLSYYPALFAGIGLGALAAAAAALVLGPAILGIRGHYFAIATLGLSIVAADVASAWEYIGAASGMAAPVYPGAIEIRSKFFYYLLSALASIAFVAVWRLYSTRLGLAMNAVRDDEDKAEAMGLHTTRCKVLAWTLCAFFLGAASAGSAWQWALRSSSSSCSSRGASWVRRGSPVEAARSRWRREAVRAGRSLRSNHRIDRSERFRQDDAVQLHRRPASDRQRLDPLPRPGNFTPAHAADRAPGPDQDLSADARLSRNELRAEHADQRAAGRRDALLDAAQTFRGAHGARR
jgi:hypothetical protein